MRSHFGDIKKGYFMKRCFLGCTLLISTIGAFADASVNPLDSQCKSALAEVRDAGELMNALASRWLNAGSDGQLLVDHSDFSAWRKDYFNPKYNSIRDLYHVTSAKEKKSDNNPVIKSNNMTFRVFELADYIEVFAKNQDRKSLQSSWTQLNKGFKDDLTFIYKQCPKK
ncbi:hypothetical protein WFK21_11415 [Yersinia enterocolitica]